MAVGLALAAPVAAGAQGPLEDPQQCAPLTAAPQAALDGVRSSLLPLLTMLPAAQALYDAYLTPGAASAERRSITDAAARREFRDAPATLAAERAVLRDLRARLRRDGVPRLRAPARPAGGRLPARALEIAYPLGFTTPGLIAGGTGGVESAAGTFADRRTITGRYALRPVVTERGVLRRVVLTLSQARLTVDDSIDFCPGGLGGSAGTALGTLTMSRLERTPHPGGGTYAAPVLFRMRTAMPPQASDVTRSYRGNDSDRDGVPNRQPWRGAGFALDRCPRTRGACAAPAVASAVAGGVFGRLRLPALLA